ncbi:hypothetical protein RIF29_34095 [Crotalaria pallida]|uniref:Sodium/calcium exchanger membrane region domain-containing protein n=1 Tax=Crotalaria pallida TaxID=3830 RepID=A0AAN9HT74_CROPI
MPLSRSRITPNLHLLASCVTDAGTQPNPFLSLPSLSLFLLLHFHFHLLIPTATHHFSLVTTSLASHLRLSPSMAAVTLLALDNGSPDVYSSLAALCSSHPRTTLASTLSASAFVSALVGFVFYMDLGIGQDRRVVKGVNDAFVVVDLEEQKELITSSSSSHREDEKQRSSRFCGALESEARKHFDKASLAYD